MADGPKHPSIFQKIGQPNLFIRHFPNTKVWIPAIQNYCGADAYVNRAVQRSLVLGCQGSASPLVSPLFPVFAGAPLEKRKDPLLTKCFVKGLALVTIAATAPISRVQLIMQSQNEMIKSGRLSMPYKGIVDCFARTIRNEGIISLWRGNTAFIIRHFSSEALRPPVLFGYKDNYGHWKADLVKTGVDCAITFLVYPLIYAETRLANDIKTPAKAGKREFKGLLDVYRKTLNSDGIAGLYRGLNISIVGRIVSHGLLFGLPIGLTAVIPLHVLEHMLQFNPSTVFLVGVGTSMLASYPMDTVSRRMMMTSGEDIKYKSSLDAFNQIIKNEGIKSLYKGAGAPLLINTALIFTFFGIFGIHKILKRLVPAKKNESTGSGDGPDYNLRIRWK